MRDLKLNDRKTDSMRLIRANLFENNEINNWDARLLPGNAARAKTKKKNIETSGDNK